jgi:hypothetical protein
MACWFATFLSSRSVRVHVLPGSEIDQDAQLAGEQSTPLDEACVYARVIVVT